MVEGVHLQYNQAPFPPSEWLMNWKIIILPRFSHKNERSEPHAKLSSLGLWYQKEEPLEYLALKASKAWLQDWGKQTSILEGTHKVLYTLGPEGKEETS